MAKVFLSYGREDVRSAARLQKGLERAGHEVWFDKTSLLPGENWKSSVVRAIRSAGAVIILLSKNSCNRSGFLNREIREALELVAERPGTKPFLIPVRLDDCEPSHLELTSFQRVDMFPNWERGLREVQKGLHAVGPSNKLTPAGNVRAFVQITTKSVKNVDALIRRMLKINNVVSVDLTIGLIDFMIIIEAPTSEAVHRAIDEIHHLREVEEAVTNLAVPSRLRSAIKAVRTRR